MLNGGGINPDGLSLDLQFAADKTLTARRGPTPVFTRGSTGTFVGSDGLIQSAAINSPRFDHDPVTLACKGLLIEEGRTNLSLQSGVIVSNSGWAALDVTTAVSGTGLDGNNAYKISEAASTNIHALVNLGGTGAASATPVVSGTSYTGSIFVKKVVGSVDWVQLTLGTAGFGALQFANFNIGNGTIGNYAGLTAGTVPRIEEFSNGWYRISMTAPATATATTSNVILAFTNNTDTITRAPSYLGSTSNEVLTSLWQFEAGSFPTSYIPTTTAPLARSADVCSITGSDFSGFYNPVEGSFATSQIFNAPTSYPTAAQVVFDVNDTTSLNRTRILRFSNSGYASYLNTVGGTTDVQISGSTAIATGVVNKFAGCMKANDFTIYLNSVSQGVDTVATMQSAPTTFTIGDISSGVATRAPIHGTIASIRYYRKRLSNEKLQALTQLVSDVDANAYIVSLLSAGATVTPTQQAAINNFIKAEKAASRWTLHKRFYLPIWGLAAPNAICMTSLTSGTFVGGVTHTAGYMQGDGTTGYLDPGSAGNLRTLGLSGSSLTYMVGISQQGLLLSIPQGAFDGNALNRCQITNEISISRNIFACPLLSTAAINTTSPLDGILVGSVTSTTARYLHRRKTAGMTADTNNVDSGGVDVPNSQPYIMARNNLSTGLFELPYDGRIFASSYGLSMTQAQAEDYSLNVKSLYETCTGLTLP